MKAEILDLLPPSDESAEQRLLGAVLLDITRLDELVLAPADFHNSTYAKVYRILQGIHEGRPDADASHAALRAIQGDQLLWDDLGHGAVLADAMTRATAIKAGYYAGRIRKIAQHRAMIRAAEAMLQRAHDIEADTDEVLCDCERLLGAIKGGSFSTDPVSIADAVAEALRQIDEIVGRNSSAGVLTGMHAYDRDIGGLFPGELTVVAARPGQGKSAIMAQWAFHIAAKGRRVYLASIEMSAADLATRQLCAVSGVSNQRIRTGSIDSGETSLLIDAAEVVGVGNLVIHDYPRLNPFEIRRAARREKAEIIFVDYLQLVLAPDKNKKRHEQVGEICKDLRGIARELKVPMVVAAQLNRQADQAGKGDPRPRLSQLKESGNIEEDSDVVLLLYRPEEPIVGKDKFAGQTWDAELKVAKNRKGNTPRFRLTWDKDRTQFSGHEPERTANHHSEFDTYAGEDF